MADNATLYNGSGYDQEYNNTTETLLVSAARTATTTSADFTNYNARGGHFFVDVSADPASASIVVNIEGKDPETGTYYTILAATAITAVGTAVLKVYPGAGAVSGGATNDILPRTYRVNVVHADGDSITYSIAVSLVV